MNVVQAWRAHALLEAGANEAKAISVALVDLGKRPQAVNPSCCALTCSRSSRRSARRWPSYSRPKRRSTRNVIDCPDGPLSDLSTRNRSHRLRASSAGRKPSLKGGRDGR